MELTPWLTHDEIQNAAWQAKLEAARGITPGCVKWVLLPDMEWPRHKPTRTHLNTAITERLREGDKKPGATIAVIGDR